MRLSIQTLSAAAALSVALIAAPAIAQDMKEIETPGAHAVHTGWRTDTVTVKLGAKGDAKSRDQIESMVKMNKGQSLTYSWTAAKADNLWHEFHGHTDEAVTFYKKAEGATHEGALTAPFDGEHGWYFENRSDKPTTVKLRLSGFYELAER